MRIFDLHCDTLYRAFTEKKSIIRNNFEISVERGSKFDEWIQCMAVWIPDDVRGENVEKLVENCCVLLDSELAKCTAENIDIAKIDNVSNVKSKSNIILTIEGGAALNGKLENIERYRKLGVRAMTLTWNSQCEIGDGAEVENPKGITDFGKRAVKEMERCGIVVDVSHASDKLFYDVAEIAERPFIATHSNSRSVCNHRRNLTDEQFNIIKSSGGIVGINFHKYFLEENNQSVGDIVKHIEHFLSLGGEDTVALGTDFDGGELSADINGIEDMHKIFDELSRLNYTDTLIDKLFFKNAFNFFQSFDI